jgi:endonuclease G
MTTRIAFSLMAAACALALAACDARAPVPKQGRAPAVAPAEPVVGFSACRQFFPGELPRVPQLQQRQPRDLCYDAFAILHSGRTKTPVFVVEKLTAAQLADASDEERTNKFFADARMPSAERATLDDYKGSGFDRGSHGARGRHAYRAGDGPVLQPRKHGPPGSRKQSQAVGWT